MKVSRSKKEYMRVNEKEAGVAMKQEGEEGPKVEKSQASNISRIS